jgi:hypothetical protein
MGNKGAQTTTNTQSGQSYSANPLIQSAGAQALSGAQAAAAQPFQMPVAPVAGFNSDQSQAFQQYRNLQGMAQPYFNQAASYTNQSAAPITGADVSQYYNPMADNVTAQLKNIYGEQNVQNQGNLTAQAGGVGADRIAVGMGDLANQQTLAAGQVYSGLYQQALQAAQQQKQMAANAGSAFAGYGTGAQNAAIQGTGVLGAAGGQQQQQTQAELNAPYQNYLARIAYQFQTPQYLAGIAGGLAPAFGGTTTGNQNSVTTPPTPTLASQILGLGTAGAGVAGLFSGNNGFFNNPSYGGGNALSGDAYGGSGSNPLSGLSPSDYGPGYADGGEVDSPSPFPGVSVPKIGGDEAIPITPLPMGGGHSGPLTGGINLNPPQQSGGSGSNSGSGGLGQALGTAASLAMMFLNRGGTVPHYDEGGAGPNLPGPDFDPSRPINAPAPMQAPWPFNSAHSEMGGDGTMVPGGPIFGGNSTPPAATPDVPDSEVHTPFPRSDPRKITPAPAIPTKIASQHIEHPSGTTTDVHAYAAPDSQMPYPDALKRDWGQDATRSPWMALVKAGATIAATPGPLGTAIGKGILAGTAGLEDQRKQLRSEQELNDKAQQLYQTAQQHLDKYNKMTAYEKASIAVKNRELDQAEAGTAGKPITELDIQRITRSLVENPQSPYFGKSPLEVREAAIKLWHTTHGGSDGTSTTTVGPGSDANTALPDPGEGKREVGKWYIGPTGKPQPWGG